MKQIGGLSTNVLAAVHFLLNVTNSCWGKVRNSVERLARSTHTARTTILLTVYKQVW